MRLHRLLGGEETNRAASRLSERRSDCLRGRGAQERLRVADEDTEGSENAGDEVGLTIGECCAEDVVMNDKLEEEQAGKEHKPTQSRDRGEEV